MSMRLDSFMSQNVQPGLWTVFAEPCDSVEHDFENHRFGNVCKYRKSSARSLNPRETEDGRGIAAVGTVFAGSTPR